jgi:hypothetical protein
MAKVSFTSLKLKVKDDIKTFSIEDKEIEVKQYLPIDEKFSIIMTSLQDSYQNGIFNELILEVCFNLNIIFYYTNINFTEKQKEDSLKLYDILESNGIIDQVIENIPEIEYNYMIDMLDDIKENTFKYQKSIKGTVESIIEKLPENAQAVSEIVDNFDPEKYENVMNFAKGIGMKI